MEELTTNSPAVTIGIDMGDKTCRATVIGRAGERLESTTVPTTGQAFKRAFAAYEGARIVLEVGTHSPWVSRLLR